MKRITILFASLSICLFLSLGVLAQITLDRSGNVTLSRAIQFADGTTQATASGTPWNQIFVAGTDRFIKLRAPCNPPDPCPIPATIWGIFDRETGLVWEKTPSTQTYDWYSAISLCYQAKWGNRLGWRLPTIEELSSLMDTSNSSPALSDDHPFTLLSSDGNYWSSTTFTYTTTWAWSLLLDTGGLSRTDKMVEYYAWCVRGGHGHDAY
jgi:hypothetical protein